MTTTKRTLSRVAGAAIIAASACLTFPLSAAAEGELNLYSSRHYDTDERLYSNFEEQTGIKINRIEASADELIERIVSEGENSPADVLLTVDAGRIWRADDKGVLAPVDSDLLNARIPAHLRHPDGHWFGFSQRARVIYYAKDRVTNPPRTYQDLAAPEYKGMVCTRSSSNIYMLSLMAFLIDNVGEVAAKGWAEAVRGNMARDPQGNDTAQLKALVSGECDIAVGNTYYFSRAIRKDVDGLPDDPRTAIGWVFPNQSDIGTHVNVSAGALAAHAPNKENAIKFLEYLASDEAQQYFSAGNDEYPAVPGIAMAESVAALGLFRQATTNLAVLGINQAKAQEIYNAAGYE